MVQARQHWYVNSFSGSNLISMETTLHVAVVNAMDAKGHLPIEIAWTYLESACCSDPATKQQSFCVFNNASTSFDTHLPCRPSDHACRGSIYAVAVDAQTPGPFKRLPQIMPPEVVQLKLCSTAERIDPLAM